jgi:hypothetical protein
MATIKSQMALNDGMSVVLKKITAALDTTLSSFEQIQRLSGNAMDVAEIEAARGALADASNAVDEMADNYRRAAQEEERLNQGIHEGTSALDGMVTKVVSLVGAYMSLSAIKGFATSSMDAANVQINAQRQLRTVLNNMGAEDDFQALADETSGNTLENTLALDTSEAVSNYEALADMADGAELGNTLTLATEGAANGYTGLADSVDGAELGNTLTLDTDPAQAAYTAFTAGVDGGQVSMEVQANTGQATAAYDAILAKASEIQGAGIYGDEAMIAGAAEFATYFSDANAILSMMDTLTDYAMGMSGGGALDTEAMVDYATGLGKIMSGSYDAMTKKGFEFTDTQKAIIEGTATEAQIVAELGEEYLGMSQDMQAAAAINAVIAEGWGGLYEAMSNTPEGKIIQLNNALGDIKENVGAGIYPAVLNFINVFQQNLPQIETAAMGLATMLGFVISLLTGMVEGAIAFGTAVSDNWSWIGPIVYGIVAALGAYVAVLTVYNAVQAITTGLKAAAAFQETVHAAAVAMSTGATFAATAAQYGFNAALLACPITWIVVAVIALVAGIMALCNWIAKTTGVAQTGFGVLTGGINVVIQAVVNAGLVVANIALGIWNALGAVCSNIGTAFHNVIANVQSWFYGLLSTALTVVAGICEALNKLPFVEFDYSGITSKADEYAAKSAEAANSKEEYTSVAEAFSEGFGTFDAYSEGWASDAFQAGAAWGDSVADKVGGMFDSLGYEPGTIEDFANQGFDSFAMDGLGNDVGEIADNTGGMAHALDVSGEELKYLRDIAERDAINRFTTAEVKIDMTGMTNKIDNSNDLDGVIRELTDGFSEALVTAAEGVHE